jgi:hypothetical protein
MYKCEVWGCSRNNALPKISFFFRKLFLLFFLLQQQFHKSGINMAFLLSRGKVLHPVQIMRKICGKATGFTHKISVFPCEYQFGVTQNSSLY